MLIVNLVKKGRAPPYSTNILVVEGTTLKNMIKKKIKDASN